ncbi:MAG: PLP-dependent transferase, partial [Planctomycetota bacterium]
LASHPAVARVRYGGLAAWNSQRGLPKGFGGMLGVEWKRDLVHQRLGRHVRLIIEQTSLGDPVSRINRRGAAEDRGIPSRYTRVSIGLEEPEDIIADFRQAIAKCG